MGYTHSMLGAYGAQVLHYYLTLSAYLYPDSILPTFEESLYSEKHNIEYHQLHKVSVWLVSQQHLPYYEAFRPSPLNQHHCLY